MEPGRPTHRPSPALERSLAIQEEAALERRHWVRIAYGCNNRCTFCLDGNLFHPQGFVPYEAAMEAMAEGRAQGATRLILSGGEASIHPRFLDLVAAGRAAGYARVQTITNGRMFAYRRFLRDALAAGLGEVTFSLHSHREEVFERLTGVKGSFAQAMAGLRAALGSRELVVSVDIVINRLNAHSLDETVAFFADLGVTEFDLLHLVPFGRAYDDALCSVPLAVEPAVLRDALHRTIRLGEERHLVLWTNRLPAPLMEGHEHLIQDPHKLADEIRGREEHISRLVGQGEPLPCRDARCADCYLVHYCDVLHGLGERVAQRNLPNLRVTLAPGAQPPDLGPYGRRLRRLWIRASRLSDLLAMPAPGVPELWELHETAADLSEQDISERAPGIEAAGRRVEKIVLPSVELLSAALSLGVGEVELPLDNRTLAWLYTLPEPRALPTRLALSLRVPERLSECVAELPLLTDPRLHDLGVRGVPLRGLPPCLGGPRHDPRRVPFVDLDVIDSEGRLDPDRHVAVYLREEYRVHSLRCDACSLRRRCAGLPVNIARAQGFAMLTPR